MNRKDAKDSLGPEFLCVGSIIIDDIVYPDGRTAMAVLGGGGVHTAAGMAVWGERAGLLACAGPDIPGEVMARLERDFDLRGLVHLEMPQARAWQIFEWDGKRTEISRVEQFEPFLSGPHPESVPETFLGARGLTVLRDAAEMRRWREKFPKAVLLWEPEQAYMAAENQAEFRAALPLADIVSPNLLEARLVYGLDEPAALVRAMLDDGAGIAALRLGEAGSLIGQRGRSELVAIPAVPVAEVVDQTGAGNTYCGGFLVGWARTGELRQAGIYGAVAASFSLEEVGVLNPARAGLAEERERRVNLLIDSL